MGLEEMTWRDAFDGIWACVSLLHVPRRQLPEVLQRLRDALRSSGVLYTSFKYGSDDRIVDGRQFTDMTEAEFEPLLQSALFSSVGCWVTQDVRPQRNEERWLNALSICEKLAR
jgi:hypothetical protein